MATQAPFAAVQAAANMFDIIRTGDALVPMLQRAVVRRNLDK